MKLGEIVFYLRPLGVVFLDEKVAKTAGADRSRTLLSDFSSTQIEIAREEARSRRTSTSRYRRFRSPQPSCYLRHTRSLRDSVYFYTIFLRTLIVAWCVNRKTDDFAEDRIFDEFRAIPLYETFHRSDRISAGTSPARRVFLVTVALVHRRGTVWSCYLTTRARLCSSSSPSVRPQVYSGSVHSTARIGCWEWKLIRYVRRLLTGRMTGRMKAKSFMKGDYHPGRILTRPFKTFPTRPTLAYAKARLLLLTPVQHKPLKIRCSVTLSRPERG